MQVLDTDVLVDLLRGYPQAEAWFEGSSEQPAVAGFAILEILQGCRNAEEVRAAELPVRPMRAVWPTQQDCNEAVGEFGMLHLSHGLGLLDAVIGATARGLGATLCTFNARHYAGISGLTTEQPYTR